MRRPILAPSLATLAILGILVATRKSEDEVAPDGGGKTQRAEDTGTTTTEDGETASDVSVKTGVESAREEAVALVERTAVALVAKDPNFIATAVPSRYTLLAGILRGGGDMRDGSLIALLGEQAQALVDAQGGVAPKSTAPTLPSDKPFNPNVTVPGSAAYVPFSTKVIIPGGSTAATPNQSACASMAAAYPSAVFDVILKAASATTLANVMADFERCDRVGFAGQIERLRARIVELQGG